MILNDILIKIEASKGLIKPFINNIERKEGDRLLLSRGLSSFGYDISLSDKQLKVFLHPLSLISFISYLAKCIFKNKSISIDPKAFTDELLIDLELKEDSKGKYFLMPPLSYALGVSIEYINLPRYLTALCILKSTYARSGLLLNTTLLEAGWKGYITLEMQNTSWLPIKVYTNEGLAQLLFFNGMSCEVSYADRAGKYQDQPHSIVLPRL